MAVSSPVHKTWGWKVHPGSQRGAEADSWESVFLLLIREQSDAFRFIRHGHNVLFVHHEASCGVAAQVNVNEEVIVTRAKQTCRWQKTEELLNPLDLKYN